LKRIGVDTGGTFTDFVFQDGPSLKTLKLPSTPQNPSISILTGLKPLGEEHFELIHGTTVATNAFIQKKMAKTAFLCTRGFEHILHIGRQNRISLFTLDVRKGSPVVPISLCYGIDERTLKDGTIIIKPDKGKIESLAAQLKAKGVESVGVLFLHSYANPKNEKKVAKMLRDKNFYVTASSEILPEYREYERAVVTILNSTLQPVIADYVNNLKYKLKDKKFYIIQSNGGILSPELIIREPIRAIICGPAGGVIAAQKIAQLKKRSNIITIDMGGTSTDVSVIKNNELILTREGEIEHLPLRIPMIDIATVGAGGGSIAKIDSGGVLQVGPESAGADPGPACYGKSDLATITDAFVVLGAILPETFLGGKMDIYPQRSIKVIKKIAKEIDKSIYETAEGIIRISISTMERALRSITLEKGEDPRFYTLMPFGGAGGLVSTLLAEKLGIRRILIPPYQGVFSALGMLIANFKKELIQSFLRMYSPAANLQLEEAFLRMESEAEEILIKERFPKQNRQIIRLLEIRYKGQSYELTIPYSKNFLKTFHHKHQQLYSYSLKDEDCEIVNLRVLAVGNTPEIIIEKKKKTSRAPRIYKKKKIYFNGAFQQFYIYRREDLMPGASLKVPAIIVSSDSTVIVDPRYRADVDEYHNILLDLKPHKRKKG
jgi:N-methylhydantoinase A